MLEIRQCCKNCGKSLPNDSCEAMICTFEYTFCTQCVENILENVYPNCSDGFTKRPTTLSRKKILTDKQKVVRKNKISKNYLNESCFVWNIQIKKLSTLTNMTDTTYK